MHLPTQLVDAVTGERIVFDEAASGDERLVWDEWRPADVEPPPAHYHPDTEEQFTVREGHLVVRLDGTDRRIGPGEEIVVPPGSPHLSYTEREPARFRRAVTPPGQWREALTEMFAYSHALGELTGVGGLLQTVLLLRAYPDVVVPARPPRAVQRVLFPVLAAVARASGRTAHHPYPPDDAVAVTDDAPEPRP